MSFERADSIQEPSNSEQEPVSPKFLQEQIRLPKSQWDEKFIKLIARKIREKQEEESKEPEESIEILREESYRRYLKVLRLDEDLLKNKRVLDLGSGEGEFIKYLIDKGITKEAYGIDLEKEEGSSREEFRGNFFQGDFRETLPVKDLDYVVSVGAMASAVWNDEDIREVKTIIRNSLNSLKKNGEIRIAGVAEPAKSNPVRLKGLEITFKKWHKLLKDISESYGIECRLEPRDIGLFGENNHVTLVYLVVIKKEG